MLYTLLGLCVLFGVAALCRFLTAISSREGSDTSKLEAFRMLSEFSAEDVQHLKEENAVMRNLLLDMVENEASLFEVTDPAERSRRSKCRIARRRELFGEAVMVLDKDAAPRVRIALLTE